MIIADSVKRVQERVFAAAERSGRDPSKVTIVAVSKGVAVPAIIEALDAGISDIGESRVQEAEAKIAALSSRRPQPAWHMIGRLQSNKVRACLRLFDIMHSVDSERLGLQIAARAQHPFPIFIEVNVSGETTKAGCSLEDLPRVVEVLAAQPRLDIRGLMTVGPQSNDEQEIRKIFRRLRSQAVQLGLPGLSMGMSNDFEIAIEEGATMVRIGSAIFGQRQMLR